MAYAVIRTDSMYGTDVRSGLVSIKYMGADGETETAIENGSVVKVGDLADDGLEVFIGGDVSAEDKLSDIVVLAAPEDPYDERLVNLDDFINEAGTPVRGYKLLTGDIFSLTAEAFTGDTAPVKGDIVELVDGTKLGAVSELTEDSTQVGTVISVETAGKYTYYVIKVA